VVCGDDRRTFAQLDRDACRLARALEDRGVGAGSWVALALPNSADFVALAGAAWKLGATAVPVSHRMPPAELEAFLALADPAVTVTAGNLGELLEAAASCPDDPLPDVPAAPWKAIGSGGSTGRPKLIVDPGPGPLRDGAAQMFGMRPGGVELVAARCTTTGPSPGGSSS
jgi:bile acid-coenzyme A ligase